MTFEYCHNSFSPITKTKHNVEPLIISDILKLPTTNSEQRLGCFIK